MKFGIVAEGGASRGLFTSGVLDSLLEHDIMCDYYIGVSAGSAYGVSYLSRQKKRNLEISLRYMDSKEYMGYHHLFRDKNFYNISFVFDKIPSELYPFDYEAFRNYKGKVEAVATNIHNGRPEYLEVSRQEGICPEIVASCAMPIFFKPVNIGRRYYLDGGVSDPIPYLHALEVEKCDKLLVILTRPRDYLKKNEPADFIARKLYKKYPYIVEDLEERVYKYNYLLGNIKELEKSGDIFVIAPDSIFGAKRTESDPVILKQLYDEGMRQMEKNIDGFKKYLGKYTS